MATYNKTITCWDQSGNYYTCLGGKVYYAVATSTTSQPATPSLTTSSSSVSVPTSSTVSTDKVSNSVDINYAWPTTSGTYFTYAAQYYNGSSWASEGPVVWKGYYKKNEMYLSISLWITGKQWDADAIVYIVSNGKIITTIHNTHTGRDKEEFWLGGDISSYNIDYPFSISIELSITGYDINGKNADNNELLEYTVKNDDDLTIADYIIFTGV